MKNIYGSNIWNWIRRKFYGTYQVDQIVEIDDECHSETDEIYCYHRVTYLCNGLEQTEMLSSHQILQLSKNLDYPFELSSHFSTQKWMKEVLNTKQI